jgi:hypothetical protein
MDIQRPYAELKAYGAGVVDALGSCAIYGSALLFTGNAYHAVEGAFLDDVPAGEVMKSAGTALFVATVMAGTYAAARGIEFLWKNTVGRNTQN